MRKIKVAVVTGSRADYGLLSNFLMEAKKEVILKDKGYIQNNPLETIPNIMEKL